MFTHASRFPGVVLMVAVALSIGIADAAAEVRKGGNSPPHAATPAHIRPSLTPGQLKGRYRCVDWCNRNRSGTQLQNCVIQCQNYWTTHRG